MASCSLLHQPEQLCVTQGPCLSWTPHLLQRPSPLSRFYEIGCHTALSPWPTSTPFHFCSFPSQVSLRDICPYKTFHLPLHLAIFQGRRHSGSISSKMLSPVLPLHAPNRTRPHLPLQQLYLVLQSSPEAPDKQGPGLP